MGGRAGHRTHGDEKPQAGWSPAERHGEGCGSSSDPTVSFWGLSCAAAYSSNQQKALLARRKTSPAPDVDVLLVKGARVPHPTKGLGPLASHLLPTHRLKQIIYLQGNTPFCFVRLYGQGHPPPALSLPSFGTPSPSPLSQTAPGIASCSSAH